MAGELSRKLHFHEESAGYDSIRKSPNQIVTKTINFGRLFCAADSMVLWAKGSGSFHSSDLFSEIFHSFVRSDSQPP